MEEKLQSGHSIIFWDVFLEFVISKKYAQKIFFQLF